LRRRGFKIADHFWPLRFARPLRGGFNDRGGALFLNAIAPALIENETRGSKKANIVAMFQTEGSLATLLCQARPIHAGMWKFVAVAWRDSVVFSFDAFSR
jgi:hypothetical protein